MRVRSTMAAACALSIGAAGCLEGAASPTRRAPLAARAGATLDGAIDTDAAHCMPLAAPALPTERAGRVRLAFADLSFEVDPHHGARITEFARAGHNILSAPSLHPDHYGATFWTSPQAAWRWPPPRSYDSDPFTFRRAGESIELTSAAGPSPSPVRVRKRFLAEPARDAVLLEYTLINHGDAPLSVAGWEISRHAARGITFFPSGESVSTAALPVVQRGGITWYESRPEQIRGPHGDKYVADGREGWLAHTDGKLLLVKTFRDLAPAEQAPGEGEIEIYGSRPDAGSNGYVEVEAQGPYEAIAPGASSSWSVRWQLRELPAELPAHVGSDALVQLARSLAATRPCASELPTLGANASVGARP